MRQGDKAKWCETVKDDVAQLHVGQEMFVSLPGLDITLTIRGLGDRTREISVICGSERRTEEERYFATATQRLKGGIGKVTQKDGVSGDGESSTAQKSFISVRNNVLLSPAFIILVHIYAGSRNGV